MTRYLISVTATSDAVEYNYFRKLTSDNHFDFYITRVKGEDKRCNMTFIPRSYTTALNHQDVIECLGRNSPLLVTYEVQVLED